MSLSLFDELEFDTPSGYILAAGRTYYLSLSVLTQIDATGFTSTDPSITVTSEFGGPLSSSAYRGYQLEVRWHTVPEPSAFASSVIAIVLLGAFGRHRRPRSAMPDE